MTTQEPNKNTITGEELVSVISSSSLLPQVVREIVIEKAIANIQYTQKEFNNYHQRFKQVQKNANIIPSIILRQFKIRKFKHLTWGHQVEPYFLERKPLLDQVSFSLIQTNDDAIAQEIYFRIQEGEESFADLAKKYSQGAEAKNGGWVGPYRLGNLNPNLAKIMRNLQPGEMPSLTYLDKMFIIVRLEQVFPAQLTEQLQEEILQQMFEEWLTTEIANYGVDLSKMSVPNLTISDSNLGTDEELESNSTDNEESSEEYIDSYTKLEHEDTYSLNTHYKWKNLQLLTTSFICLLTGGLGGFYLSGFSKLSYANLAPETSKNDLFYDAITQATEAANLTQTAQSPSEWKKVSQSWINAIALLSSLPKNHPKYALATQKIQEYERNLNYSNKNSQNLQNSFRIAVNHATKAANLTQTATSGEEWETIIKHWENAIASMKAVTSDHPEYFTAQQKTIEYQRNLNYAFSVVEKKYPESYAMSKI
ncbi:peptidylprolyl isomerase [Okeanomitos corallinicola TIOX110]|uniref:peptidylprolyl isomerase n=1 Tax=Okeanomitos corallinicola TIOX110 TaxID=3133117 RepID=A0ABZ2V1Q1_9CYAN